MTEHTAMYNCIVQVYRGTWTNIDIAAKEYLPVDDWEVEAGREPSQAAHQRARVSGRCQTLDLTVR